MLNGYEKTVPNDRGNGTGLNCVTWRWDVWNSETNHMFQVLFCWCLCYWHLLTIFYGLLVFLFKVLWMLAAARLFTVLILHHFAKHTFSCSTWSWLQALFSGSVRLASLRWVNTPACFVMVLASKKWSPKMARSKKKKLSRHAWLGFGNMWLPMCLHIGEEYACINYVCFCLCACTHPQAHTYVSIYIYIHCNIF